MKKETLTRGIDMSHGETIAEMVRVVLASDTLRETVLSELDLTDKAAQEAFTAFEHFLNLHKQ